MTEFAKQEMSPTRSQLGVKLPGDDAIKDALGASIEESLEEMRRDMDAQCDVVIDYAADVAGDTANPADRVSAYRDDFLATNPVYQNFSGGTQQRDELEQHLLNHLTDVATDLAPIVSSEQDFWPAMQQEYTYEEAEQILDKHFSQADTFKTYRDALNMTHEETVKIGFIEKTFEVDYTDEAIRVIDEGEQYLQEQITDQLDNVYR